MGKVIKPYDLMLQRWGKVTGLELMPTAEGLVAKTSLLTDVEPRLWQDARTPDKRKEKADGR